MIKAIIFDMDGVLIDAKEWHYEALNRALLLFGFEISRYDHLTSYDGLSTRQKLDMLSKERDLPIELHAFINELKQIYTMEIVHARCKPKFIHEFLISRLKVEKYKLVVASNSIRSTIDVMLHKAGLLGYFDFFLSNQDVTKAKPDSEIYLKAISLLDLDPKECLIIEDNINGVKAAIGSGAHVLEVNDVNDVNYYNIIQKINHLNHNF